MRTRVTYQAGCRQRAPTLNQCASGLQPLGRLFANLGWPSSPKGEPDSPAHTLTSHSACQGLRASGLCLGAQELRLPLREAFHSLEAWDGGGILGAQGKPGEGSDEAQGGGPQGVDQGQGVLPSHWALPLPL